MTLEREELRDDWTVAIAGDHLYALPGGSALVAVHKSTGRVEKVLDLPGNCRAIAFGADGSQVYLGGTNRVLAVDLRQRRIVREWPGFDQVSALHPESPTTLLVADYAHRVLRLDVSSGAVTPLANSVGQHPTQIAQEDKPYPRYKSQFTPRG